MFLNVWKYLSVDSRQQYCRDNFKFREKKIVAFIKQWGGSDLKFNQKYVQ